MANPAMGEGQLLPETRGWWWVRPGRDSLALRAAQKPFGQSQWGLRSTLDLSWFWVFIDSY